MTRFYENPGLARRTNLSSIVLVAIALYGVWELSAAARAPAGEDTSGTLFAVAFVGLALYGLNQVISDARDLVAAFDVDPASGRSLATLWRPLGSRTFEAPLDRLRWRFHIKIGRRGARTFFLYVDHPSYPRPLRFELSHRTLITDELRNVAGTEIDAFEQAIGIRKEPPASDD